MKNKISLAFLISAALWVNIASGVSLESDSGKIKKDLLITGVGDMMFGSAYPSEKYLPPHDNPLRLLGNLTDTLAGSDITFGNLEGSFLDHGEPAKKCKDSTKCWLFRMPEQYASVLAASGFDIISLANNHFGDFGLPARKRTMELLDSMGISYGGLVEHPWSVFEKEGLLIGFCAFAPNAGTISITDLAAAQAIIRHLADTCEIVIVSFHGGAEGSDSQHVTRTDEMMFTENRGNVYEFSHKMIDAGADVVFGHGPHVSRAVEVYRDRFIAYSLGNFCTYGRFNLQGPNGLAPIMRVRTDSSGKFISGKIIPVFQIPGSGVQYDPESRVIRKIRELTLSDFPESGLSINDNGEITYKQ